MIELEISKRYHEQKMRCPVHLSVGQEFLPGIIETFFYKNDKSVKIPCPRSLPKQKVFSKKIDSRDLWKNRVLRWYGGSMHLIKSKGFYGSTAIVGNTIPIGAGISLSMSLNKTNKNLTYIFLGDGAVETGIFFETLNFVVLKKLPCLFICENNSFSVYSELRKRQPKNRKISKLVSSFGIKTDSANTAHLNDTFKNLARHIIMLKKNKCHVC